MNLYNALPLLEGWEYLWVVKTETVSKGIYKSIFSRETKGWLFSMGLFADDAYATLRLTSLSQTGLATPQSPFESGVVQPTPLGTNSQIYIRPSVLSTAGIYGTALMEPSEVMPIKGLTRLEVKLGDNSTQATATIAVGFVAYEIINEELFIRSVRKFKYGWLGWVFGVISKIPGLKYIGIPEEIREVVSSPKKKKGG